MQQHFSGLKTLQSILYQKFPNFLISDVAKTLLCEKGGLNGIPHFIFYAKTPFLTHVYIKQFLSNHFQVSKRDVKCKEIEKEFFSPQYGRFNISYLDHHYYKEFDVHLFTQCHYDKRLLVEYLKTIVNQKNVITDKHVIYIKGVESLSHYCLLSLVRLIEIYTENAVFVLSTTRILMESKLSALCCYINVNVDVSHLTHELIMEQKKKNLYLQALQEDGVFEKMLTKHTRGDIVNIALLLDIPKPHLYVGYLQKTIETFLHHLTEFESLEDTDMSKLIKDMSIKISASCIPFSNFVHITIQYFAVKYPEKIYDIIALSAKMEHLAVVSNKEVFCYEDFFFQLVNIACEGKISRLSLTQY